MRRRPGKMAPPTKARRAEQIHRHGRAGVDDDGGPAASPLAPRQRRLLAATALNSRSTPTCRGIDQHGAAVGRNGPAADRVCAALQPSETPPGGRDRRADRPAGDPLTPRSQLLLPGRRVVGRQRAVAATAAPAAAPLDAAIAYVGHEVHHGTASALLRQLRPPPAPVAPVPRPSRLRWPARRGPTRPPAVRARPRCRSTPPCSRPRSPVCRPGPAVQLQFAADGAIVLQRIAAVRRQRLDEVDQDARPLNVPQKLMSQPDAVCAPSISPGRSASTNARSPPIVTRPRLGCLVVKG